MLADFIHVTHLINLKLPKASFRGSVFEFGHVGQVDLVFALSLGHPFTTALHVHVAYATISTQEYLTNLPRLIMIPLLPTFALALVSFVSSAFVILRVIIPALPPSVRVCGFFI